MTQLIAAEFGVDPAEIAVDHASTMHGLPSIGPGGSWMTVMLAGAVRGAAQKLQDKIVQIAGARAPGTNRPAGAGNALIDVRVESISTISPLRRRNGADRSP